MGGPKQLEFAYSISLGHHLLGQPGIPEIGAHMHIESSVTKQSIVLITN